MYHVPCYDGLQKCPACGSRVVTGTVDGYHEDCRAKMKTCRACCGLIVPKEHYYTLDWNAGYVHSKCCLCDVCGDPCETRRVEKGKFSGHSSCIDRIESCGSCGQLIVRTKSGRCELCDISAVTEQRQLEECLELVLRTMGQPWEGLSLKIGFLPADADPITHGNYSDGMIRVRCGCSKEIVAGFIVHEVRHALNHASNDEMQEEGICELARLEWYVLTIPSTEALSFQVRRMLNNVCPLYRDGLSMALTRRLETLNLKRIDTDLNALEQYRVILKTHLERHGTSMEISTRFDRL
jgi:hypothetical protein